MISLRKAFVNKVFRCLIRFGRLDGLLSTT